MDFWRITFKQLKWIAEHANKTHGSDFFVVPMGSRWEKRKYGICVKSATLAPPTFVGTAKECYMFLLGFDIGAHFIKDYDNMQKNFINKEQKSFFSETFVKNTVIKIYESDD